MLWHFNDYDYDNGGETRHASKKVKPPIGINHGMLNYDESSLVIDICNEFNMIVRAHFD